MFPKAKVTSNVSRDGFSSADILYENLLDRLGGKDMLELMIGATDFNYIYYNGQGLKFTFKALGSGKLQRAQFIPTAISLAPVGVYFTPQEYHVRLTVEMRTERGFEMTKPYHSVMLMHPERLVHTFETVTKSAVSFG